MSVSERNVITHPTAITGYKPLALVIAEQFGFSQAHAVVMTTPAKLREQKRVIDAARDAIAEAQRAMNEADAFLMVAIAAEVNEAGKPAYSNKEARDAAQIWRRRDDPEYQAAFRAYQQAEAAQRNADADARLLEDQFRAARTALEAVGNLLRAVGH